MSGPSSTIVRIVDSISRLGIAAVAVATIASFFAQRWWLAELFTHYRLQYIAVALPLVAVAVLRRRLLAAGGLVLCIAVHAAAVAPRVAPAYAQTADTGSASRATAVDEAATISILAVNIQASNPQTRPLLDLIDRIEPDAILVLEHTRRLEKALDDVASDYPHRLSAPGDDNFGIALYSRVPVGDAGLIRLVASDAISATIESPNGPIRLLGVHLFPPTAASAAAVRSAQLDALAAMISEMPNGVRDETAVCGDFNLSPYSPFFRRLIRDTGLIDAGAGRNVFWTWPVTLPPLGIPIDHCLVGARVAVSRFETLGDVGSDHYPLLIEMTTVNP